MDKINRKRLEWVATAGIGARFDEGLFGPIDKIGNGWGPALSEAAQAALDDLESMRRWKAEHIADWRPIAEAPIPPAAEAGDWWTFPCLLQDAKGLVGEGFCRYVTDNRDQGRKAYRMLRWYRGAADRPRDTRVCPDPVYFQPLPQPRKD